MMTLENLHLEGNRIYLYMGWNLNYVYLGCPYLINDIAITAKEAKTLSEWFAKAAAILENKKDSGSC